MDVLLFGDQTSDCQMFLREILIRHDLPLLSSFLEQVHTTLSDEVASLPTSLRRSIPPFSNVAEFVERYYQSDVSSPAIESTVTCVAQLSHFIGFFEERPLEYLQVTNTKILGICTGLLSASTVASCNSLVSLVPLAVQAVRIAFRLGSRVSSVGNIIQSKTAFKQEWSTIVFGINSDAAADAIEAFNKEQNLSQLNKVYISAIGAMSVTITGAPAKRQLLFDHSACFQSLQRKDIPIRGPYHADHLYDDVDVDDIMNTQIAERISQYNVIHPLVELEDSGQKSALQLFRNSVTEILARQVHWDQLVKTCVTSIRSIPVSSVRLLAMGPTTLANNLVSSLKVGGGINISLEDHVSWSAKNVAPKGLRCNTANANIAIVGMAGRFPNAADHEAFWSLLEQGLDLHREIPKDRFDAQAHCDPSGKGKNKTHTPYGCFIDNPGLFDPRFFNMSPREATQTDPMQRLAISTAYEAMEMAGFVINRTASTMAHRVATFYGQTSDDWREINAAQDVDTYFITGGVRAFGPGRINYHFGFSGPSYSVDTACSSSMAAINLACTSLRARDCDTVFTGGMNVLTNPDIFAGLSKGQFLSKTGSCKTYDEGADGYCRGDGVVTLILKRLDDAIAENDPILGVIRGIATNHSAEAISITHPHAGAQKFLFQKVMDEAGVDIRDVQYVEMHGTGTQAGDGVEMDSVSSVFAPPLSHRSRRRADQPVFVGSVKANIGHGEAVSGVCALTKALLMFKKNLIPPHCGIKTRINPLFPADLDARALRIASRPTPFPRASNGSRFIFVNNFSAAGGNTAMLLEDAPSRADLEMDPRSAQVVVVSAKSLSSFKRNLQRLLEWSKDQPDSVLSSLAYTTTARRSHYQYRVGIPALDMDDIRKQLDLQIDLAHKPISSSSEPRVAFVFTGQGSHYLGMGRQYFSDVASFRQNLEDYDQIAQRQGFPSFIGVINGSINDMAPISPIITQLAITCLEIALAQLWDSWGVTPSVVVGHSLGEYAALQVAGVLSILDTIFLVGRRAQLLVSKCESGTHGMLAVRADIDSIGHLMPQSSVEIACFNAPGEIVLSGRIDDINDLRDILINEGVKATKLEVPYAFHSAQVDPILQEFEDAVKSVVFNTPRCPVISPLLADVVIENDIFDSSYLAKHCRDTVDFEGGLSAALEKETIDPYTLWIELGPHPVCSNMVKSMVGEDVQTVPSLRRGEDSWQTINTTLASLFDSGVSIDWTEYHRNFAQSHEVLSLPSYSYDDKNYWIDYKANWCLTKGELSQDAPPQPAFSTTSIHKIVSEIINGHSSALVIAESNLMEPLLRATIEGHMVNGVGLCPSSLHAEMALALCNYAHRAAFGPDAAPPNLNVGHMETHTPLVLELGPNAKKEKILQMEARMDFDSKKATIIYRTILGDGKKVDQAKCVVLFEDASQWTNEWERHKYLVQGRIDGLRSGGKGIHHIQRGLAYKLFAALVQYDDKYRGMEEVILNSESLEATSRVSFQSSMKDGNFFMSPYFIDSVAHISGFIMNANDAIDSKKFVYISHGWDTMRFAKTLEADKKYSSYVKMQPVPGAKQMVAGDVYVFEGDDIIGVVGGLKFQCVPRALLDTLFGVKAKGQISMPAPVMTNSQKQKPLSPRKHRKSRSSMQISAEKLKMLDRSPRARSRSVRVTEKALLIIADEVGCEMSELMDPIRLSDLGIDSLMALSISGRYREELELNFNSTVFNDTPTIAKLKEYLQQFESEGQFSSNFSGMSTPDMGSSISSDSEDTFEPLEVEPRDFDADANRDLVHIIRSTIAAEMGVEIDEISDNTDLATMGMDSLMSLSILGALREKTGLAMQSDLLTENTCVEKIETSLGLRREKDRRPSMVKNATIKALQARSRSQSQSQSRSRDRESLSMTPVRAPSCPESPSRSQSGPRSRPHSRPQSRPQSRSQSTPQAFVSTGKIMKMGPLSQYPPAQSILLQGNPRTATRTLFLLPDGSGSATSYTTIPDISADDLCVFGLNCPFMKDPASFTIGVAGVTQIYMAEIKRKQPKGPYLLGGWSAGGVLAYEMTRQLIARGETVSKLVLIDSPCPVRLEALPSTFHQFCAKIGLLGKPGQRLPSWLLPHFASAVRELTNYSESLEKIGKIDYSKMPPTTAIWARDGLVPSPESPKPDWDPRQPMPNSMDWLVNNRSDLGPNGWENLVGKNNVSCVSTSGNHFTMMRAPITNEVAECIKEALDL